MKIHGTAKGAALSTKDFGVAFGGGAAPEVCQTSQAWDDEATDFQAALYAGNKRTIQGTIFITGSDFIGQNLKTATFYIIKTGSPEGSISCRLYPSAVKNSGLATVTETASNTFSIQTGWSDGDHEFTFSGDNDIEVNNALVIVGTFTSSDSSNYINLVQNVYSPDPKEQNRQYQKGVSTAQWEGQDDMNGRFKVCNY